MSFEDRPSQEEIPEARNAAARFPLVGAEYFEIQNFETNGLPPVRINVTDLAAANLREQAVSGINLGRLSRLLQAAGRDNTDTPYNINLSGCKQTDFSEKKAFPAIHLGVKNSTFAHFEASADVSTASLESMVVTQQLKLNKGFWRNFRIGTWAVFLSSGAIDFASVANQNVAGDKRLLVEWAMIGVSGLGFFIGAKRRDIKAGRIINGSDDETNGLPAPLHEPAG